MNMTNMHIRSVKDLNCCARRGSQTPGPWGAQGSGLRGPCARAQPHGRSAQAPLSAPTSRGLVVCGALSLGYPNLEPTRARAHCARNHSVWQTPLGALRGGLSAQPEEVKQQRIQVTVAKCLRSLKTAAQPRDSFGLGVLF